MAETNRNIWAPWRMDYIESIPERAAGGCFLCRNYQAPADDARNYVLHRSDKTITMLNRFPYSTGHLLVAPARHEASFEALPEDVLLELTVRLRDAKRILEDALQAQGFNIGLNLGHCAGAGLPEHLHWHVVPRWGGDTNFMPVLGDVKVIPEALLRTYQKLLASAKRLGI